MAETGKVFSSKAKGKKDLGIISIITLSQNDHQVWKRIAPPPLPKPSRSVPIVLLKGSKAFLRVSPQREEPSEGLGLFGVEAHNCSPLQQRQKEWETQGKRPSRLSLSLLHSLPTATSHGTGDKGSWGHTAWSSCSSLFCWLRSHHGSAALDLA